MKKNMELLRNVLIVFILTAGWVACEKDPLPDPEPEAPSLYGIFILNQGTNNQNNASLSVYNLESGSLSTVSLPEDGPLGDLGQDMLIYGSKLYISMSNSSNIRVLDVATQKEIKKIAMFNEELPLLPRFMTAYDGNLYVSCYTGGIVARIDTVSLTLTDSVKIGSYPEGISACPYNKKLYVANSGWGSENTVSEIDIASFTEDRKIEVGMNPNYVKADNSGHIYLSYQGSFGGTGGFQQIDVRDHSVKTIASYPTTDFALTEECIYYYNVAYNEDYSETTLSFGKLHFPLLSPVTKSDIVTDGTTMTLPFGIAVHPVTKDVYLTDAVDFMNPGKVYVFNPAGKKINEFTAGIGPCKLIFY